MNPVIYKMKCGCRLKEDELVRKWRLNKNGNDTLALCCPKHKKNFLSYRERKCVDCGVSVFQYHHGSSVAERCDPCGHEEKNKNARAYQEKKYAGRKVLFNLLAAVYALIIYLKVKPKEIEKEPPVKSVEDTLKDIAELGQMLKPKPKKKAKCQDGFSKIKGALTIAEARRKHIPHIPLEALFDLRNYISKGMI